MLTPLRPSCIIHASRPKETTLRAGLLAGINQAALWEELKQRIEPFCPKATGAGRRPTGIACLLRMYTAQQCFWLSNEGIEDAINDSQAIRDFVSVDLTWGATLTPPRWASFATCWKRMTWLVEYSRRSMDIWLLSG